MTNTARPCRYEEALDMRVIPGEHEADCSDPAGHRGCKPCTQEHCWRCSRGHLDAAHPVTCPTCVGEVRALLDLVVRLSGHLLSEAIRGAVNPDQAIPGGDAMVMLGPASEGGGAQDHGHESRADPTPPLLVLGLWEDDWRAQLGQETTRRATVASSARYLKSHLTWASQRHDAFPDFVGDLRRLVAELENVLHDGVREERSKTPCLDCGSGTLLVKRYSDKAADDHWLCPKCKRPYSAQEFELAKAQHLASDGAARFVKLQDAIEAIPRPEQTVRTWVRRLQVTAYCDRVTHQVWVWWPDVRRLHREAEMRETTRTKAS